MPNPIPVILLGRLVVDKNYTGQGVGRSMLQAAIRFSQEVSKTVGVLPSFRTQSTKRHGRFI